MTQFQKESAYQLGQSAFRNGDKCIPAQDPALMEMTRRINKFGEGGKLAKAWTAGWTAANLAPCKVCGTHEKRQVTYPDITTKDNAVHLWAFGMCIDCYQKEKEIN